MPLPACLPPAREGRLTLTSGRPHHQVSAGLSPDTWPLGGRGVGGWGALPSTAATWGPRGGSCPSWWGRGAGRVLGPLPVA